MLIFNAHIDAISTALVAFRLGILAEAWPLYFDH